MPVKTKRKAVTKAVPLTPKYERLRLREWMMFWVLFAATVALVCAIFGDVDVRTLRPVGVTSSTNAGQQELDELRAQVVDLSTELNSIEQQQVSSSERIIANIRDIPFGDLYFYDEVNLGVQCDRLNLNTSTPTQSIVWTDEPTGLQASLPYSFDWGTDRYLVTPYEELGLGLIAFGPIVKTYDCNPARDAILAFDFPKDPSNSLSEIRKEPGLEGTVRQRTINGITVLSYRIGELAGGNFWEVFGRSYHYRIRSEGWLTDAEAIKIIQSLRVTK